MSLTRRWALRFADALQEECQRAMKHLKVPGYPRAYFLSYLLRDIHTTEIWGRLGNINYVNDQPSRNLYCDCRVGSYRYDQVTEGGLDDNSTECDSYDNAEMPIGNDIDALKYHVWRMTDARYRESVRDYLMRKSRHITYVDANQGIASLHRAEPNEDLRFSARPPVPVDQYKEYVKRASRVVKRHPEVKSSWVEMRVKDITRVFVSSEGVRVVDQRRVCELGCDLWLLTDKGEGISTRITHVTGALEELPDQRQFNREIRQRIALLGQLVDAATLKSYAGPVLLAPQPAGILMHEVLGHRLEGSRLLSTGEGQTFARDLGRQILPTMLSVEDDPTLTRCLGKRTVGSYRYDDEGSAAKRVELVQDGVLVGFLSGRAPISPKKFAPNGHARNEYHERAISRMGHLMVTAREGLTRKAIKERFLEEVRAQGLPFGVMVLDAEGGETATDAYNFQAFLGSISVAKQVWADGRENLLRNVSFVGTPVSALRTIIAAANDPQCHNAFCGAESGVVPVSTTCPSLLLGNLELQATDHRKYTQYVLPMPLSPSARKTKTKTKVGRGDMRRGGGGLPAGPRWGASARGQDQPKVRPE